MKCPTCDCDVGMGNPRLRGLLINEIASLGAEVLMLRERLDVMQKRRWSKQFKKQHDEHIIAVASIEHRLAVADGRLRGLRFFEREFCGL